MGGWLALIPWRVQVGVVVVTVFLLALFGWRNAAVNRALDNVKRQRELDAARAVIRREEIENEVEGLGDDALRNRSLVWVRKRKP